MDWTGLLVSLGAKPRPGCTPEAINRAGREIGLAIPPGLADLLTTTNGFSLEVPESLAGYMKPDDEWYEPCWPIETLVSLNRDARVDDLIPTYLLAFGDNGADQWFCVDARSGSDETVYSWAAIGREETRMAPDLATFWREWLSDASD